MSLLGYQVTDVAESGFERRVVEERDSPALRGGKSERFSFLGWCGMLGGSLSPDSAIRSSSSDPEGSDFTAHSHLSPPRPTTMPTTDSQTLGDEYTLFPVEDIVQYPLPGYVAPASVQFSPDDRLITYLYSPDSTLSRKIYAFDVAARLQRLLVSPPGGGVDEGNLSTVEKLRRERLRERGLGVTRYEWAKGAPSSRLMVPLPSGVCRCSTFFFLPKFILPLSEICVALHWCGESVFSCTIATTMMIVSMADLCARWRGS
jgi:hypothetical protein